MLNTTKSVISPLPTLQCLPFVLNNIEQLNKFGIQLLNCEVALLLNF